MSGQNLNYQLNNIIMKKILRERLITFAEFMDLALYHPNHGYYASPGQKIGRDGDYYTSVHVSNVFGQTIGRQLVEMGFVLGWDNLAFVEYGAGEGYLAKDILATFSGQLTHLARHIPYYICERSGYHREQQRLRLQDYMGQVQWIDSLAEINDGKPFKGIIFSNELVDAFPVHRVKQVNDSLKEIYIGCSNDSLVEIIGELSNPWLAEYFPFLEFQLEDGQEAEINLKAVEWLQHLGSYLSPGFVLTIDYGYEINELSNPRRFNGTIICYSNHQADYNPLERIGLKDITSHVNFTALMKYGKKFGFEVVGLTNQMKFLAGLQVGKELGDPNLMEPDRQKIAFALKELLMPDRMGERFQVLIQQKGLESKPNLSGLKGFG